MKQTKPKKSPRRLAPYPPEFGTPRHELGDKKLEPLGALIAQDPAAFVATDEHHAIIKARLPDVHAALVACAFELNQLDCERCNEGDTPARLRKVDEINKRAAGIARWLYGDSAKIYHQTDPRGCPLFVSWDRMPDSLRSAWDRERGLPIYLKLSDDWRAQWD